MYINIVAIYCYRNSRGTAELAIGLQQSNTTATDATLPLEPEAAFCLLWLAKTPA